MDLFSVLCSLTGVDAGWLDSLWSLSVGYKDPKVKALILALYYFYAAACYCFCNEACVSI